VWVLLTGEMEHRLQRLPVYVRLHPLDSRFAVYRQINKDAAQACKIILVIIHHVSARAFHRDLVSFVLASCTLGS
jgi:hypothetical protein